MPDFQNPTHRTVAERLNRAAPFRRDERMEVLAEMRDQRPEAFAKVAPAQVIALGLYESDRAKYEQITGGTAA